MIGLNLPEEVIKEKLAKSKEKKEVVWDVYVDPPGLFQNQKIRHWTWEEVEK